MLLNIWDTFAKNFAPKNFKNRPIWSHWAIAKQSNNLVHFTLQFLFQMQCDQMVRLSNT